MYDFRLQPVRQNDNGRPPSPERDGRVFVATLAVLAAGGRRRHGGTGDVTAGRLAAPPAAAKAQFRRGVPDGAG